MKKDPLREAKQKVEKLVERFKADVPHGMNREEAIRARESAATDGPWVAQPIEEEPDRCDGIIDSTGDHLISTDSGVYGPCWPDAEFIAHARVDIPYLLAALDAERQQVQQLTQERDEYSIRLGRLEGEPAAQHVDRIHEIVKRAEAILDVDRQQVQQLIDRKKQLQVALENIENSDPDCQCEHDSEDCCARQPENSVDFCARCFAHAALAAARGPARPHD